MMLKEENENKIDDIFVPPAFGVTQLGNSHGFDY